MKDMMIGVDLAKRVVQLHGARDDGGGEVPQELSREQFLVFMAAQPTTLVVFEACGSASYWAREMEALGHEPRLRYGSAFISGFIEWVDRDQVKLILDRLEDWIDEDHLVRVVDLFVNQLDLVDLEFGRAAPAQTGRPGQFC